MPELADTAEKITWFDSLTDCVKWHMQTSRLSPEEAERVCLIKQAMVEGRSNGRGITLGTFRGQFPGIPSGGGTSAEED